MFKRKFIWAILFGLSITISGVAIAGELPNTVIMYGDTFSDLPDSVKVTNPETGESVTYYLEISYDSVVGSIKGVYSRTPKEKADQSQASEL